MYLNFLKEELEKKIKINILRTPIPLYNIYGNPGEIKLNR